MKKHSLKILSILFLLISVTTVSWYNLNPQTRGIEELAQNNLQVEDQNVPIESEVIISNDDSLDNDPYNLQAIYQEGVIKGIIDQGEYSFEKWKKENEEDYIPCYKEN